MSQSEAYPLGSRGRGRHQHDAAEGRAYLDVPVAFAALTDREFLQAFRVRCARFRKNVCRPGDYCRFLYSGFRRGTSWNLERIYERQILGWDLDGANSRGRQRDRQMGAPGRNRQNPDAGRVVGEQVTAIVERCMEGHCLRQRRIFGNVDQCRITPA
jgi:hypothetical protein